MIEARHSTLAHGIFAPYVRSLFRKHFHGVYTFEPLPSVSPTLPIILAPNHSLWWDGFIVYMLNHAHFRRTFYVMMLEEQLRRYWFFQYVGAYSIRQESPRGIVETMRYSQSIISLQPPPLLTVFPQGEQLPSHIRPLGCKRGIESILLKTAQDVALIPIAIRAVHTEEARPRLFIQCAPPIVCSGGSSPSTSYLEEVMTNLLHDIDNHLLQKTPPLHLAW